MKQRLFIFFLGITAFAPRSDAAVNVPLRIQEAIYPGSTSGVTRTNEPVTVGIPLPDDATNGATDVSQLTLTGATVGQFRVLGRWPSGRIKWVLVDTQASLNGGGSNTSITLTSGGSGNFGGSNLASDNGGTITINTGSATFTIRKANFNVIDQAVVGGTTVLASGTSQGLVVTGPPVGQTACGNCTNLYSSANDGSSTAVIEENGPAKTVIRASGTHKDTGGNGYLQFTVRLYFYRGKNVVKVTSVMRNAEYGGSNSFASAYKGIQAYELRLSPSFTGSRNYSIANHTGSPTTGTLSGSDSVYLYQGQSQLMKWQDWCGFGCVTFTNDTGYRIVRNGSTVVSGTDTQYPQGWADLSDSNGVGVSIGVYQLAAYWPKSLEFNAGGSDVRIGIWARENSQPYYQAWPQSSTHDLYLNFHSQPLSNPDAEFLKFQHYLVARAPMNSYNAANVFPYPLIDPAAEDSFYRSVATSASPSLDPSRTCCIEDVGTTNLSWPLNIYRFYAWGSGGGANQTEFRWSFLLNYLTRGMTGRYLNAAHFYRFQSDSTFPHSDGFNWRDKSGEINGFGFPSATSANENLGFRNWKDQEHGHWYGMTDYYFMTGDETIRDSLLDGPKDWFLNPNTYQNGQGGGLFNTRSIGVQLIGAARFAQFLQSIGDPDAAAVLAQGVNSYNVQVKPDLCVSGFPAGCTLGNNDGGPWNTMGVSRVRGVPWGAAGTSGTWCGNPHSYRVQSSFQPAIMIQGLLELRNAKGPSWGDDYWTSLDLAYGMARWNLSENFVDDGSGRWDQNGFRFGIAMDVRNNCPGESPEPDFQAVATQTTAMTFLAKYLVDGTTNDWATKFKINTQKDAAALGISTSDFGAFHLAALISVLNNPTAPVLNNVAISGFTNNGGGTYTLSWTVPANTSSYRIKWGAKQIVDWIGFDPANNVFTGNPNSTMAWFAATNVSNVPTPGSAGSTQSITINTGNSGLTAANFSVKAYVGGTGGGGGSNPTPPPSTPGAPQPPSNVRVLASSSGGGSDTGSGGAPSGDGPVTSGQGAIIWTRQAVTAGWPGYNGWLNLYYDDVAQQTLLYGVTWNSNSIYSTDVFTYKAPTNTWTHLGGTGDRVNNCAASTPIQPGNRHPGMQMAVDTRRNWLWLFGGVCQGINRQDMFFMTLNADPRQNAWHQVTPTHYPVANNSSALVYDPDTDVLFLFGSDTSSQTHDNWVYCRTFENPSPGTLTSAQVNAGCAAPDDWTEVQPVNGVQPPGVAYPGMVYDTVTRKVIQYGGMTGGGVSQNQTWAYDVQTRTWRQKALGTAPPPLYSGPIAPQPALAYNSLSRKVIFHQTSNGGAPADWEYDPVADTWTQIAFSGGATVDMYMTYDRANNALIGFSRNPNTGAVDLWQGAFTR